MKKNFAGRFKMNTNYARLFALLCVLGGYVASGVAVAAQEVKTCTPTGVALQNPQGIVLELTGDVKATVGKGATCPVSKGQTLVVDTVITTGAKSNVVLRFADGQGVSLGENTTFHVKQYVFDRKNVAKSSIVFDLIKG